MGRYSDDSFREWQKEKKYSEALKEMEDIKLRQYDTDLEAKQEDDFDYGGVVTS